MKNNRIIVISLIFFLLVNTSYFIELLPGMWDLVIAVIIALGFLVLGIILIRQLYKLIKEKASDKSKIRSTLVLSCVLIVSFLFPTGIVNYDDLYGEDLLIVGREGAANCQTIIKIKKNNKFIHTSLCFGVDKYLGTCKITGDTVKFHYPEDCDLSRKYEYGIIRLSTNTEYIPIGQLILFQSLKDTIGFPMNISFFANETKEGKVDPYL